ncbi:MAG: TonB-dependent receptor domain-containing protein [Mucilaginibacter sp.]
MTKYLITLIGLLIFSSIANAQSTQSGGVDVVGNVVEKASGKDVPYATIFISKADDSIQTASAMTDSIGHFSLHLSTTGIYILRASAIGYVNSRQSIEITSGQRLPQLKIYLQTDIHSLNEVQIKGKQPLLTRSGEKLIVNVSASSLLNNKSVTDMLKYLPTVNVGMNNVLSINGKIGTRIYIDGKPAFSDDPRMLQGINAGQIERIEIISNPSSKYEAEGAGGIINIILKRSKTNGFSNELNNTETVGKYYSQSSGDNFSVQSNQIRIYGNLSYTVNNQIQYLQNSRYVSLSNDLFVGSVTQKISNQTPFARIGIEFTPTKNQVFDFSVSALHVNEHIPQSGNIFFSNPPYPVDTVYRSHPDTKNTLSRYGISLNYDLKLDTMGQNFTVSADAKVVHNHSATDLLTQFLDISDTELKPDEQLLSNTPYDITLLGVQADYVLPIHHYMTVNAGLKTANIDSRNNNQFYNVVNGVFIPDLGQSFRYHYKENITAAYISFNVVFNSKINLTAGGRLERTGAFSVVDDTASAYRRKYYNFFPNINLNYNPEADQSISLTYSKRIERPRYQDLNPFVFYIDLYDRLQGNPELQPQITDSYELNYLYKGAYNINVFYSNAKSVMLPITLSDGIINITQMRNLSQNKTAGVNLTIPIDIFSIWHVDNNLSAFKSSYSTSVDAGNFYNKQTSFRATSTHSFKLPGDWSFYISGTYNSPFVQGIYHTGNIYWLTAGLQKSLKKSGLSFEFTADDILKTFKEIDVSNFQGQQIRSVMTRDSRTFSLSVVYKLKKGKEKKKTDFNSPLQDQTKRL